MNNKEQRIKLIEKAWPRREGKTLYVKYLKGEALTRGEAITAKCYECICGEDNSPCIVDTCPLQDYCPYNK